MRVLIYLMSIISVVSGIEPIGEWRRETGYVNEGTGGAKMNGFNVNGGSFEVRNVGIFGDKDHSILLRMDLPEEEPYMREWILNYGQSRTGAHHLLYNPRNERPNHGLAQWGMWDGPQVKELKEYGVPETLTCVLVSYNKEREVYNVYIDGMLEARMSFKNSIRRFNIVSDRLVVGKDPWGRAMFSGEVHRVRMWDREVEEEEAMELSQCIEDFEEFEEYYMEEL